MDKFEVKLDQAARAAWMSYVGGMTQDEIATQLGVSRPGVQRLLALARQEGLVKVHIDHPISTCMALGSTLRERFLLPAPWWRSRWRKKRPCSRSVCSKRLPTWRGGGLLDHPARD